ncbi:hypothetical protein [Beduinella massiliensis]|uniref:hypothetical protein n=1 Tax=Beduinella massiliensis TaxID=1852363 RepID=UPI000C865670
MKTILYIAPVDWLWIKQRPQFLAEELSQYDRIHVVYPYANNRMGLQKKTKTPLPLTPYFTFPSLGGRLSVAQLNKIWSALQIRQVIRRVKPDILWLSMPWQMDMVPTSYKGRIVYDCMDDYVAIQRGSESDKLLKQEAALVKRADTVFASSESLRRVLAARHGRRDTVLLRNGYHASWPILQTAHVRDCDKLLRVGYFGTIGRWFDFDLLLNSLNQHMDVEYHLYGPTEAGIRIPAHPRLIVHGVVEHERIPEVAQTLDVLMMPFVINDIVISVDPVKLYEYICLRRPILCVRYPEVERFAPFVLFYEDAQTFAAQLDAAKTMPLCSMEQTEEFLHENSWAQRAATAHEVLNR